MQSVRIDGNILLATPPLSVGEAFQLYRELDRRFTCVRAPPAVGASTFCFVLPEPPPSPLRIQISERVRLGLSRTSLISDSYQHFKL